MQVGELWVSSSMNAMATGVLRLRHRRNNIMGASQCGFPEHHLLTIYWHSNDSVCAKGFPRTLRFQANCAWYLEGNQSKRHVTIFHTQSNKVTLAAIVSVSVIYALRRFHHPISARRKLLVWSEKRENRTCISHRCDGIWYITCFLLLFFVFFWGSCFISGDRIYRVVAATMSVRWFHPATVTLSPFPTAFDTLNVCGDCALSAGRRLYEQMTPTDHVRRNLKPLRVAAHFDI